MIINGNLNLESSSVDSLGKLKEVKGYLDLNNSKITSLSNGLEVKGSLYLSNTKITQSYIKLNFPELLNQCIWN